MCKQDPRLKKSLEIVLELACGNMLDANDPSIQNYEPLRQEALAQDEATDVVAKFIKTL